ncbi:transcription initiation factor IIF, alpha subunit, partial [Opisthorchis viverrini]
NKSIASPVVSELSKPSVISVISQTTNITNPLQRSPATTTSTPLVVIRTLPNATGTSTTAAGATVSGGLKITPVISHPIKVATACPTVIRPVGVSPKSRSLLNPPTVCKPQQPVPDPQPPIKPDQLPSTSSSATQPSQRNVIREMQVRVPNRRDKRFSVLRFHTSDHPDLTSGLEVFMQRENNLRQFRSAHNIQDTPDRGAGSEFGREAREEARLRKYGIIRETYRPDDQPWVMTVGKGKTGRRRFKGAREGSVSENVEYFVFCQCKDGNFDAYPVHAWYKMKPEINYRFLREEEAEVEYSRLHKTMNLFNVMIKRKLTDGEGADEVTDGLTMDRELGKELRYLSVATEGRGNSEKESGPQAAKSGGGRRSDRTLKLTDLEELNSESDADAEDEEEESAIDQGEGGATEGTKPGTSKQKSVGLFGDVSKARAGRTEGVKSAAERARLLRKKQRDAAIVSRIRRYVKKRRTKKGRPAGSSSEEDDPLEEAQDDSEVDDHEGDEVDYMTNSSSDEDKLSADEREKIYEEPGVDDEAALKALLTDVSTEEEEAEGLEENQTEMDATDIRDDSNANGVGRKRPEGNLEPLDTVTKGYEPLLLDDDMGTKSHRSKKKVHGRNEDDGASSSSSSSSSSIDGDSSSYSSSSSDSEVDVEEKAKKSSRKTALLQKLSESIHGPSSATVAESGDAVDTTGAVKRRLTDTTDSATGASGSASKKARVEPATATTVSSSISSNSCDGELMSTVRKYLMRKPITVTELLKKIRLRKLVGKNEDAQTALANVLRQLRPIKQIINGQHALSLKH